jgi:DNA-binding MarR family transcriptional regulator
MASMASAADGPTQASLGGLLRRANRLVHTTIEARFAAADLNFTQWRALYFIRDATTITAGELAESMELTSGSLTRIVDGLEARGFVLRDRGNADRRIVNLQLTIAGVAKLGEISPVVTKRWEGILAGLADDEVENLLGLLSKLSESIERNAFEANGSQAER